MHTSMIMAMLALLQTTPLAGQKLVNPQVSDNRFETTRVAKVSYIMGVNTGDANCGIFSPANLQNPVIYRADSGPGRQLQIFAGDTGLVLVGKNLDLVEKIILNFESGSDPDLQGTIVSRRAGKTVCGETPDQTVMTVRFNIPSELKGTKKTAAMEIYAKNGSVLAVAPRVVNPNDPCLPQNINLEAGLPEQCAPGYIPLREVHSVSILPLPVITSKMSYDETGSAPTMSRNLQVNGSNINQFTTVSIDPLQIASVGGSYAITNQGIVRAQSSVNNPNPGYFYKATVEWNNMRGGRWFFKLIPELQMYRQPKTGDARPYLTSMAVRNVHDTLWADETDRRRKFLEANVSYDPREFYYTASAPSDGGGNSNTPPPTPAHKIDGFDPGNRLYIVGGGGTTMVGNTPSESQQILTALASQAWCSALPQPAPAQGNVRAVALGQTTLGDIQWGIKNTDTAPFTGTVTAELRFGGTRVDTLTFTGTLAVGQTYVETYQRPTQTVAIARESLGPICFHVGLASDPVVEDRGYTVVVTSPGNLSESLRSIP